MCGPGNRKIWFDLQDLLAITAEAAVAQSELGSEFDRLDQALMGSSGENQKPDCSRMDSFVAAAWLLIKHETVVLESF